MNKSCAGGKICCSPGPLKINSLPFAALFLGKDPNLNPLNDLHVQLAAANQDASLVAQIVNNLPAMQETWV